MSINYAEKYSEQIDERFKLGALTTPAVNDGYDFTGVQTVCVYSVPTVAMNDYSLSGAGRYGSPDELANSVQELTLARDRSFTFTIDRRSQSGTENAMNAGEALNRQLDEVVIPEIDIYRLNKLCQNCGSSNTAAVTKANAYEMFLKGGEVLSDKKVPIDGRVAFVTPEFYRFIKLDPSFTLVGNMANDLKIKGLVGMIDNTVVVMTPKAYLPASSGFVITHPLALVSPVKLAEYKIHDNPPGINGWLIEGRVYYDAFVLDNKKDAVYVHLTA